MAQHTQIYYITSLFMKSVITGGHVLHPIQLHFASVQLFIVSPNANECVL